MQQVNKVIRSQAHVMAHAKRMPTQLTTTAVQNFSLFNNELIKNLNNMKSDKLQ